MKGKHDHNLYILKDGTYAAPGDCKAGDDGVLRHGNGVPVAMTPAGEPMTVKRQVEEGGNAHAAQAGRDAEAEAKAG